MNCAVAFHERDLTNVIENLKWVRELGGCRNHDLFLMPAKGMELPQDLLPLAHDVFRKIEIVPDAEGITSPWQNAKKDAAGPNSAMRQFAWHFYLRKLGAWFFWEPDAVFLKPGCVDKLDADYQQGGKPFMGAKVNIGGIPHMTGNAIYPQDTISLCPSLFKKHYRVLPDNTREELAFDIIIAPEVLPQMHETKLIQQIFDQAGKTNTPPSFPTRESLGVLSKEAVLFHRNKDLSLVARLRERLCNTSPTPSLNTQSASEAPTTNGASATLANSQNGNGSAAALQDGESKKLSNVVHTYYDPVPGMDAAEQEWLLAKWAMSWKAQGWIPKVLSRKDAETHPAFQIWVQRFRSFPTINPPEYELACWLRWIAMVQVGGNLLVDYDVLNYGFKPNDCEFPDGDFPALLSDKNPNPGVILATAKQYENAVILMAEKGGECITVEHGKPHASDQNFVQKFADRFTIRAVCWEHGREEARTAKLVHYSHSSCGGRPRSEVIPAAEALSSKPIDITDVVRPKRLSEIEKVRSYIDGLVEWMGDMPSRKNTIREELRKAGLVREAKKRKVRKGLLV